MSHRIDQLALRRRQLLLRNERLRADLAADQRVVLSALSGVDRAVSIARTLASPVLMSLAGAFVMRFFRRTRPTRFAMRGLMWISTAKRVLAILSVLRTLLRSRRPQAQPPP